MYIAMLNAINEFKNDTVTTPFVFFEVFRPFDTQKHTSDMNHTAY